MYQASFAAMRLKMGQILFYRVLEKVLEAEKKKGKSIGALLDQTPFHQVRETCFFQRTAQGTRLFLWRNSLTCPGFQLVLQNRDLATLVCKSVTSS
jgi:hypothetical protein